MAVQKLIKRVLIPGGTVIAIPTVIPLIYAEETQTRVSGEQQIQFTNENLDPKVSGTISSSSVSPNSIYVTPKDLPIYDAPQIPSRGQASEGNDSIEQDPSQLQQGVTKVRKTVMTGVENLKVGENKDKLLENIDNGIQRIKSAYAYLTLEENYLPRAAAITGGGLFGLMLARRGGVIKRFFYTSVGLTAMASVCYPKEAVVISEDLLKIGKYYAIIAYQKFEDAVAGSDVSLSKRNHATLDKLAQQLNDVSLYGFRILEKRGGKSSMSSEPETESKRPWRTRSVTGKQPISVPMSVVNTSLLMKDDEEDDDEEEEEEEDYEEDDETHEDILEDLQKKIESPRDIMKPVEERVKSAAEKIAEVQEKFTTKAETRDTSEGEKMKHEMIEGEAIENFKENEKIDLKNLNILQAEDDVKKGIDLKSYDFFQTEESRDIKDDVKKEIDLKNFQMSPSEELEKSKNKDDRKDEIDLKNLNAFDDKESENKKSKDEAVKSSMENLKQTLEVVKRRSFSPDPRVRPTNTMELNDAIKETSEFEIPTEVNIWSLNETESVKEIATEVSSNIKDNLPVVIASENEEVASKLINELVSKNEDAASELINKTVSEHEDAASELIDKTVSEHGDAASETPDERLSTISEKSYLPPSEVPAKSSEVPAEKSSEVPAEKSSKVSSKKFSEGPSKKSEVSPKKSTVVSSKKSSADTSKDRSGKNLKKSEHSVFSRIRGGKSSEHISKINRGKSEVDDINEKEVEKGKKSPLKKLDKFRISAAGNEDSTYPKPTKSNSRIKVSWKERMEKSEREKKAKEEKREDRELEKKQKSEEDEEWEKKQKSEEDEEWEKKKKSEEDDDNDDDDKDDECDEEDEEKKPTHQPKKKSFSNEVNERRAMIKKHQKLLRKLGRSKMFDECEEDKWGKAKKESKKLKKKEEDDATGFAESLASSLMGRSDTSVFQKIKRTFKSSLSASKKTTDENDEDDGEPTCSPDKTTCKVLYKDMGKDSKDAEDKPKPLQQTVQTTPWREIYKDMGKDSKDAEPKPLQETVKTTPWREIYKDMGKDSGEPDEKSKDKSETTTCKDVCKDSGEPEDKSEPKPEMGGKVCVVPDVPKSTEVCTEVCKRRGVEFITVIPCKNPEIEFVTVIPPKEPEEPVEPVERVESPLPFEIVDDYASDELWGGYKSTFVAGEPYAEKGDDAEQPPMEQYKLWTEPAKEEVLEDEAGKTEEFIKEICELGATSAYKKPDVESDVVKSIKETAEEMGLKETEKDTEEPAEETVKESGKGLKETEKEDAKETEKEDAKETVKGLKETEKEDAKETVKGLKETEKEDAKETVKGLKETEKKDAKETEEDKKEPIKWTQIPEKCSKELKQYWPDSEKETKELGKGLKKTIKEVAKETEEDDEESLKDTSKYVVGGVQCMKGQKESVEVSVDYDDYDYYDAGDLEDYDYVVVVRKDPYRALSKCDPCETPLAGAV